MSTKQRLMPLYWGLGLLLTGLFFTLFALGPLRAYQQEITWGVVAVLGIGGAGVLAYAALRPERWWSFIPGCLLLSMAGVVYLSVQPQTEGAVLGGLLLVGLGVAHLFIFLSNRQEHWWAWISAGGFFVLALVVVVADRLSVTFIGALLFLGMSVVFYLLYLISPPTLHRWWMATLATVLLVGSAFVVTVAAPTQNSLFRYWPVTLIAAGIALITWTLVRLFTAQPAAQTISSAPAAREPIPSDTMPSVIPVPEEPPNRAEVPSEPASPPEDQSTEESEGSQ